jgi:uncharacterized protein YqjF (DUF2071 family)
MVSLFSLRGTKDHKPTQKREEEISAAKNSFYSAAGTGATGAIVHIKNPSKAVQLAVRQR